MRWLKIRFLACLTMRRLFAFVERATRTESDNEAKPKPAAKDGKAPPWDPASVRQEVRRQLEVRRQGEDDLREYLGRQDLALEKLPTRSQRGIPS